MLGTTNYLVAVIFTRGYENVSRKQSPALTYIDKQQLATIENI